jgi:hypothetical protein
MANMRSLVANASLVLAACVAAIVPLLGESSSTAGSGFAGWPTHYEGRVLTELALTKREAAFVGDFPGHVGRFSDGRRELIIRWVNAPTRRLHSSADCLRGSGYKVVPTAAMRDASGAPMGCFLATRQADELSVCEVIRDERGESWPDVSAWYWHALFGASPAPWWSLVVAERI